MSFNATVVATNGSQGVCVGDSGWGEFPKVVVDAMKAMPAVEFFDGQNYLLISRFRRLGDALDVAHDHAETLRVPVVLLSYNP